MNFFFVAYRKKEYAGRTRELLKVFNEIGNVIEATPDTIGHYEYSSILKYITFVFAVLKYSRKYKNVDYLVLDDRKAFLPGLILLRTHRFKKIIIDCWELYFANEVDTFVGKIGCYVEKLMIKKSDIIIVANEERAEIMKERFSLSSEPVVFTNIRILEEGTESQYRKYDEKYDYIFKEGVPVVISTAGCSLEQGVDLLVKNIKNIKTYCKLVLVGNQYKKDKKIIENIISRDNLSNVVLLPSVGESELKYLLQKSKIGIVTYGKEGINNLYCASGKIYEYAHEGLPLVATSNPPLVNICEKYGIGCIDDDFHEGIDMVFSKYNDYAEKVKLFSKSQSPEMNNDLLKNKITKLLDFE